MKTFYLEKWNYVIVFSGLLLLFSGKIYAATPQYVRVSGIVNPSGANGIYAKQVSKTGYDPNWDYWKHETATYYIYARKYSGTEYFWNINATIANTNANDDNAIFYSDGAHGVEFLTTFPSPHQVLNWVPLNGTETAGGCIVEEYTGVTSPEISIIGNSSSIADNSASTAFSNYTKFGSQNFSSGSVTRTYTISNSGTANLTITNATLSGTNSNQFSITQPLSLTIAAGASTTFTVTFDPSSAGIKTATVTVNNNDSDESVYDFAIDGYGYTPGDLVVSGITGAYTAANTGYIHQGVLNGFEYWKSANNYYIYNDGTSNWYIDNDQNSSIVLFFSANNQTSPSVLNVTSWTAEIGAGPAVVSAAVATADINVKGNSITIAINDATPSFSDYTKFGSIDISTGSRTRTYTIENTGGASLTSLAVTLGGTDAAEFSKTNPVSSTVSAYGTTTFTITFDPTTAGTKTATVSIASNDPDENPYLFYISGDAYFQNNLSVSGITGTYVAANGTYLYQGILNEFQYWKHSTQNYWVYNSVYSNQHWWYIDTDQSSTAISDFLFAKVSEDVAPVGLTGWTAGTGATGTPVIVYASPEMDLKGNSTSIFDGDASPSTADYTDFGSVNVSSGTVSRTYSIYNTGSGALNLSGTPIVAVTGDFTVTTQPSNPVAATTGTTTFTVQFDPTALGTRSGTISIANNDNDENPYNFSIQGTGIDVPTVTTTSPATSITATSATLGGYVTANGGSTVTERGVVYSSIDTTPMIGETDVAKVIIGAGDGSFNKSFTGLSSNTTYYVRAFATNAAGTSYGTEVSFRTLTPGTFTGTTNNDWATASNWTDESVPTSTTNVTIPSGLSNYPIISATTSADCNIITIASGASLTIQSSSSGTGSLIINGTATGSATTQCYLTADHWSIISPSASGQTVASFLSANTGIPTKTTNRGMMDYNTLTNSWNTFYPSTGATGTMDAGKGFMARVNPAGVLTFSGNLTSGTKTVSLVTTGERWNSIGNPYTSAIYAKSALSPAQDFLSVNTAAIDDSYECLYLWDDASASYKIIGSLPLGLGGGRTLNQTYLQSGQGFHVKAASGATSVSFTKAMQIHQPAIQIKSAEIWPTIELLAKSEEATSTTLLAFDSKMSKGLDPGYDAGLMRGSSGIELFTRLIEDNGVDFAIQCLPLAGIENAVIPIGFDSKTGGEVVFTAKSLNLPTGLTAILEDRLMNSKTLLDSPSGQYKTTVQANSIGTGRFYLHLKSGTTGIDPTLTGKNINAWVERDEIVISGVEIPNTSATLYDVAGRTILVNNLQPSPANRMNASHLKPGIYILKVLQSGRNYGFKIHID